MRILLAALGLALSLGPAWSDDARKIVLVAGRPSHGPGSHEFNAGCFLIKKCLDQVPGVESTIIPGGWPDDDSVLNDADAIFLYMDGGGGHPAIRPERLARLHELAARGVGIGCGHYAVEVPVGDPGTAWQELIGGHYEHQFSCNPFWSPRFNSFPDHPVANGVEPFAVRDEWYFNMRFRPDMKGVTPILSAVPPDDVRDGPYVWPKGPYPHIMASSGRPEAMMWVVDNENGQRGFGFTGGHVHVNWWNENYRKVLLNALLWIAHAEVPEKGVETVINPEDLLANLDPKK